MEDNENLNLEKDEEILENKIKYDYNTIVLSGASTKGIVLLGGLQYAYDNCFLKNVTNYIGTSAGSIICYLLAIGYTPVEIIVYICTNQLFEKIQNFNIIAMINGSGALSFNHIHEQLEKMTIEKIGFLPNLEQLYSRFGKKLTCVTHNFTTNTTEYLNYETFPTLPCITALRMSSNLPLIFDRYKYGDNFYIDGGVSNNFPIDKVDIEGNKVFGLTIDFINKNKDENFSMVEYIYNLMFIPICESVKLKVQKCSSRCDIFKLNSDVNIFNFNINSKKKLDMFSSGYQQLKNYV